MPKLKQQRHPPKRVSNQEQGRTREYLLPTEVEAMLVAAKSLGRHQQRDYTMILLAYRHGLRVSELIGLRWEQIDLTQGHLHVSRLKNGVPSVHPLRGTELRALRQLQREYPDSPYVFVSERSTPLSTVSFRVIVSRAGVAAGLPFPVHPHMLRHACGYYLASKGQDTRAIQAYLGHKKIQHTVRYTELAPGRFNDFWQD